MDATTKIILTISFIIPIIIIIIGCLLPKKKYSYSYSTITKKHKILFIRREGIYDEFYIEYLNEDNTISSKTIYWTTVFNKISIGKKSQLIEDVLIIIEIETGEEDIDIIKSHIILTKEDYDKIKDAYVEIGW